MGTKTKHRFFDLIQHLFPALITIIIFEVLAIRVYSFEAPEFLDISVPIWIFSQTIGTLCWGAISDQYCRKKALIATQALGIFAIAIIYYASPSNQLIFLLGVLFSPLPIARAALIDNFPRYSKLQIISLTFISQFIPWCFFTQIANANYPLVMFFSAVFILINLIITALFFSDRRDDAHHSPSAFFGQLKRAFNNKKALFTMLALLPPEIGFFLSDAFLERLENNDSFFSALGIGCLIGALMSLFYRRTPHIAVLTTAYAMGGIISFLYLISFVFLHFEESLNIHFQLILLSVLGGFYLPFVYDIVLTAISPNYRGTTCAVIELICFSSALFSSFIMFLTPLSASQLLSVITLLFLLAIIFQKKAETDAV